MTRVVTITSIPLERDSRTFKFAASVARMGHESVVVEGERSSLLPDEMPFEVISPAAVEAGDAVAAAEPAAGEPGPVARFRESLPSPARTIWAHAVGAVRRVIGPVHNTLFIFRMAARDYRRRNRETGALLPDADVYWLHSFYQFPAVYLKARKVGARFLYDTPDAYWEEGVSPTTGRVLPWVMRAYEWMEMRSIKRAERFTSVSDGVADLLEARFGRRPEVVPNFHDLRIDEPTDSDVRSVAGVPDDAFLLVVVGNMKPELLVEETLLALAELPDRVHIAFVGRNHEENRDSIERLGLGERVHIIGHVAPTEIVSFIRTADAAPVLSRATTTNDQFSLPNKFFHAVAAGLPVLYPPLPEMAAIAERHQLGVGIDPADPASIVAGVGSLIEDPEAVARYRANVEKAREVLNWEHEEASLAAILEGKR